MASLLKNILLGRSYIGIELYSLDKVDKVSFILAERKKNELTILKTEIYNSLNDLTSQKYSNLTVLVINNNQVLRKEINGTETNDKKILHKAFPNIHIDDFYYEIWKRPTSSVISICRKSYVNEVMSLMDESFPISNISLGVSSIFTITGFHLPAEVETNTKIIKFNNDTESVSDFYPDEIKTYTINGLEVRNSHLLAFCGILTYVTQKNTIGNITDYNNLLLGDYKQKVFFIKGIKAVLGTILMLLLLNFLLFSYYFEKANETDQQVLVNKSEVEAISKIKLSIKNKKQKIETFTSGNAERSSIIINEIVKELPSSILLSQLIYHPLAKKPKKNEAIVIQDNKITIIGSTLSNNDFTKWIEKLESHKWIKKVIINSFGKDEYNETQFSLEIYTT